MKGGDGLAHPLKPCHLKNSRLENLLEEALEKSRSPMKIMSVLAIRVFFQHHRSPPLRGKGPPQMIELSYSRLITKRALDFF